MSIHKTRTGRWEARFRSEGRQRSITFPTKREAARFDAEIKASKAQARMGARVRDELGRLG